jgi:hypothetical protein
VSDTFDIDVTAVKRLGETLQSPQVGRVIHKELTDAGQRSGRAARDAANQRIGNKSKNSSGRLGQSAVVEGTERAGFSFTTRVVWNAKSDSGFPYAKVHHDGRNGFTVKNAKALRFMVGGDVIFAKRVGPAAGTKYAERGLQAARPRIAAEHNRAAARIAQKVEGMV